MPESIQDSTDHGSTRRPAARGPVTCSAVARRLGVSKNTVRRWCRSGSLRSYALRTAGGHYRLPLGVLEALLSGQLVADLATI